jgi:hypothetical protein
MEIKLHSNQNSFFTICGSDCVIIIRPLISVQGDLRYSRELKRYNEMDKMIEMGIEIFFLTSFLTTIIGNDNILINRIIIETEFLWNRQHFISSNQLLKNKQILYQTIHTSYLKHKWVPFYNDKISCNIYI